MAISYVQSISRMVALGMAVGMCASQQITSRPVFLGREVISDTEKRQILSSFATPLSSLRTPLAQGRASMLPIVLSPSPQYDPAITANYNNVDAERSLLIHDCANFCGDEDLAFATVFAKAAGSMGLSDAKQAAQSWYSSATKLIPSFTDYLANTTMKPWAGQSPDGAPYQLLAIVNRLDLATPDCDVEDRACNASEPKWRNAELHFVYGLVQNKVGAHFTLIIEFVLPPLSWRDFRTIEGLWDDLRNHSGAAYLEHLRAVLSSTPPASSVRLRTNSQVDLGGGGPWFLAQWDFTKNGLNPVSLPEQIRIECTRATHDTPFSGNAGCPEAEPDKCLQFAPLWDAYAKTPLAPRLTISSPQLLPMTQCYVAGTPLHYPGMDNLPGKCSKTDLRARNVISLQQCSFCHGTETNNPDFTHIHNRDPKSTVADLSGFLKGNNPKPTIDELNEDNSPAVFAATIKVNTPGCDPTPRPITRHFHDLARRSAFLAAVLVNQPDKPPDSDLTKIIQRYGTNFTH